MRAIERLGKPGIDRLLALAESGVKKETDRVVDTFAVLRTRAGYEGLPNLLKYPHLTRGQRDKLIRSCGNYLLDPPIAPDPLFAYLDQLDDGSRTEAVDALAATPEGTRLIARRYLDGKLPRELRPRITRALQDHAGKDAELGKMLEEIKKR